MGFVVFLKAVSSASKNSNEDACIATYVRPDLAFFSCLTDEPKEV